MKKTEDAIANSAMIVYRRRNTKSSSISKVRANKRRIEPQMIIRDHVGLLQVRGKKRRIKRQRIIRDHDAKGEPNIMNTPAMARALEFQANLPKQFPSMVKFMRISHVSGGYWLNLAKKFTDLHLTHDGSDIVLEDENGGRHNVVYLKDKSGLSGGWRAFATDHKLMYGDVLIFQLIKPDTFKVYIIRASLFAEVDAAIGLLKLDMDPQSDKVDRRLLLASNSHKENDAPILIPDDDEQSNKVHSDSESDFFSEYVLKFEDAKTIIKDFRVQLDGLNYEIPNNVREKYYKLCRSQNMFLHENIGGDNIKLVTGMISETVNVADAVRQVKSTTSVSHIQSWDITLKSFEELGMTVGFLRSRIHELLSLDRISKAELEANRRAREDSENEMKGLKRRLGFVKDKLKKLDEKIDALVAKDEDRDAVLQKIAGAPW